MIAPLPAGRHWLSSLLRFRVTERVLWMFFVLSALPGCVDAAEEPQPPDLPPTLRVVSHLTFAESDTVLNVAPQVRLTDDGRFLIADSREAKVRLYDEDGGLVWQLGRRGEGPEEFQVPMNAFLTEEGLLFVADAQRGITRWNVGEARVEERWDIGAPFTYGAQPLGDTTIVVSGLWMGSGDPLLLHNLDLATGTVTQRFFPLPVQNEALRASSAALGSVAVEVDDDEILAAFSLVDTVYVFSRDGGELLRRVPVPIPGFPREPDPELEDRPRTEWAAQFRLIRDLHRLPDGSILVQYAVPGEVDERYGVTVMNEGGDLLEH